MRPLPADENLPEVVYDTSPQVVSNAEAHYRQHGDGRDLYPVRYDDTPKIPVGPGEYAWGNKSPGSAVSPGAPLPWEPLSAVEQSLPPKYGAGDAASERIEKGLTERERKICGFKRKPFFILIGLAFVTIAAAVAGGVGGGLAAASSSREDPGASSSSTPNATLAPATSGSAPSSSLSIDSSGGPSSSSNPESSGTVGAGGARGHSGTTGPSTPKQSSKTTKPATTTKPPPATTKPPPTTTKPPPTTTKPKTTKKPPSTTKPPTTKKTTTTKKPTSTSKAAPKGPTSSQLACLPASCAVSGCCSGKCDYWCEVCKIEFSCPA